MGDQEGNADSKQAEELNVWFKNWDGRAPACPKLDVNSQFPLGPGEPPSPPCGPRESAHIVG